jgi:hypothetical protein
VIEGDRYVSAQLIFLDRKDPNFCYLHRDLL